MTDPKRTNYKTVLFDFDGTVFDTVEGITRSIQYALRKHGREEPLDRLRCFAGPPLVDKFMEVFGVSQAEAEQLVLDFRERYVPVGVYESAPFPGIGELLQSLRQAGLTLGIATSKPQNMAELLLEQSGLKAAFDVVTGSSPSLNNEKKWQIVERALALCGADKSDAVLVGDTKYDVLGAAQVGIPCIGVRWGYAAPGELEAAGAARIVETMDELLRLLTA
ncbi:MAG: HAD hydrolase-like protein [Oscillospiraceae bacterium]|nr:HAD hydrolase-like protein [Oscillospiraceae bacterium]